MDCKYVFEDIDIGGGWTATIEVSDFGCDGVFVTKYMAVDDAMSDATSDHEHPAFQRCEAWLSENAGRIPELHVSHRRKRNGRRALARAVEHFDLAISGQTQEIIRRPVATLASELMRNGGVK